jgi:hypothetical protein
MSYGFFGVFAELAGHDKKTCMMKNTIDKIAATKSTAKGISIIENAKPQKKSWFKLIALSSNLITVKKPLPLQCLHFPIKGLLGVAGSKSIGTCPTPLHILQLLICMSLSIKKMLLDSI